jgi:hypothetical protein
MVLPAHGLAKSSVGLDNHGGGHAKAPVGKPTALLDYSRETPVMESDVMDYGLASGWSAPGAMVVAAAQTFAAECIVGPPSRR